MSALHWNQRSLRRWQEGATGWWRWTPLPLAAVYLAILLAKFTQIIANVFLNADFASGPVIGELFSQRGPHATVVLGYVPWYATLFFELATKSLPAHRQIWEGAGCLMLLGGAALISWQVWKVAGRWAAAMSGVLLLCASPDRLNWLLPLTVHAPVWFCVAVLGAVIVLIAQRGDDVRPVSLVLAGLISGALVGVNGASDKLLVVSGVIPFVLASGLLFISASVPRRTVVVASGTTLVTAVVFWILTDALARRLNIVGAVGSQYSMFAGGDQVSHNVSLWWQSIATLANGNFFGHTFGFTSGVYFAAGLLSIGAVLLLPAIGWKRLKPALGTVDFQDVRGQLAFTMYWCSSALLLTLSFWVSAAPADIFASRYLVGLLYAGAAVLPATAAGWLRREAAVAAGTAVFALSAVISIAQPNLFVGGHISDAGVNSVVRFALSHDASVGYSGYWDAAPITWASRSRVTVYPVAPCGAPSGLCTFNLHYISSWYTPRRLARSFIVTDTISASGAPLVTPPSALGRPIASAKFGSVGVYVYPYDIASRIQ